MGSKGRGVTLLGSDSLKVIHCQALSAEELCLARPTPPPPAPCAHQNPKPRVIFFKNGHKQISY